MKHAFALVAILTLGSPAGFPRDIVELLTTEYEPFCGVKGNTMWCDLVNSAFAREGVDIRWRSFPQDREKSMVSEGMNAAFLSGTLVVTPEERPSFLLNDDPMIYASIVAFFQKAKYPAGLGLKKADDLRGRTVGVILGTGSVTVLLEAGVTIDGAPDKDLLMKKLVVGRDDVAVVADLTGLYALRELVHDRVNAYGYEMVYNSPIDLIFSRQHPRSLELRDKFNAGIAKIKADGTFMRIVSRYYPKGQINKSILPKDLR